MKLPESEHSIQALIDKAHEERKEDTRGHLGCSVLGHPCDRWLWLSFRWAVREQFPGRILRVFRRGQNEEETIISDLRAIGIDLRSSQARVNLGAHVSGSVDGIIESGVPEAPKKRHVFEAKTHSLKSFNEVEKSGVEKSKPMHFVQMQLYMHGLDIDRALYVAVCKDDDRIYTERVRYDKAVASKYIERGHRIALADRMPPPLSTDPSWFECKFCAAHEFCFESHMTKEVNCRTCARSTPTQESTWHCEKWDDVIPYDAQKTGCDWHVLHPDMVSYKRLESNSEDEAIYEINGVPIRNGNPDAFVFASSEILANPEGVVAALTGGDEFRDLFGGRIVG